MTNKIRSPLLSLTLDDDDDDDDDDGGAVKPTSTLTIFSSFKGEFPIVEVMCKDLECKLFAFELQLSREL